MASYARKISSRFGGAAASKDDSGHGRKNISNRLTPLQVNKDGSTNSWVRKEEVKITDHTDAAAAAAAAKRKGLKSRRSPRSELIIARRLEELSQLESPLLRELADRLGRKLNIETPRCAKKFEHPYTGEKVGQFWEELQGRKKWAGLLEPKFDRKLKAEILRYGEFAQATYDAFDDDKTSKHYGTCKYTKADLLHKVGLENRGYEITKFIYATTDFLPGSRRGSRKGNKHSHEKTRQSNDGNNHNTERGKENSTTENASKDSEKSNDDKIVGNENCEECDENVNNLDHGKCKNCTENSKECNWIGFVAVCTSIKEIARLGRRDIVIAWRGSKTMFDWIADFKDVMRPTGFWSEDAGSEIRVSAGFLQLYSAKNASSRFCKDHSARDQVRSAIEVLVSQYKHEGRLSITLTGHSLGSALATLCAYDIAECQPGCQLDLLPGDDRSTGSTESQPPPELVQDDDQGARRLFPLCCISIKRKCRKGASTVPRHHLALPFGEEPGGPVKRIPVTVFSFAGPKVGNKHFVKRLDEVGVAVLRVVNKRDKVPKMPGLMIHRRWKKLQNVMPDMRSYRHVGVKLKVDNELSKYLQKPAGLSRAHCLEGYLHLVDSYQGIKESYNEGCILNPKGRIRSFIGDEDEDKERTFKQRILGLVCIKHRIVSAFWESKYNKYDQTFRDHALVNKYKDFLQPKYAIPAYWWQEKNKGLVQDASGKWKLPDRDETIPGTKEEEQKELERSIRAAWERSRPYHDHRRTGASYLSRHLTMR